MEDKHVDTSRGRGGGGLHVDKTILDSRHVNGFLVL